MTLRVGILVQKADSGGEKGLGNGDWGLENETCRVRVGNGSKRNPSEVIREASLFAVNASLTTTL